MVFGRIIGTLIGFSLGLFPAILGFAIGYFFDKSLAKANRFMDPDTQKRVEQAIFSAVFPLLGRLAKSDGRISEEEISGTEHLMDRMGLSTEQRQQAIALFKEGSDQNYDVDACISSFLAVCGDFNNVKQILLVYLITIAFADGELHTHEDQLLGKIASSLGYSSYAFNHLLGMVKAQNQFYRGQQDNAGYRAGYQQTRTSESELATAYKALGVAEDISDKELKRAYRKLMSEYHPDKLAGSGAPEDMVKLATERSQEIQAAYALVKEHRRT